MATIDTKDYNDLQNAVYEQLESMSGEDVARALTDWHGMQLLDRGFAQHLVDEGYCTCEDLGCDEEDDDEDNDEEE